MGRRRRRRRRRSRRRAEAEEAVQTECFLFYIGGLGSGVCAVGEVFFFGVFFFVPLCFYCVPTSQTSERPFPSMMNGFPSNGSSSILFTVGSAVGARQTSRCRRSL